MAKFIVEGGIKLQGKVAVSGAKNAAIKMIAASILATRPSILRNVPRLSDVDVMIKLVEGLGVKSRWIDENSLELDPKSLKSDNPDPGLARKLRASVVLIGPLLARFGKIAIPLPGGDQIGKRPIDTHLEALQKLGGEVKTTNSVYQISTKGLVGTQIFLKEMSVTATENTMMAAVLAKGKTTIETAASEPEIANLADFLNQMGAKIKGAGTPTIEIDGVKKLGGALIEVIPDRIEAGTLLMAALVTGGVVTLTKVKPNHLANTISRLEQIGAKFAFDKHSVTMIAPKMLKPINLDTRPYPGFSTDLQSPMAVVLTQAIGKSKIFETLFENRFNYVPSLQKMGAKIEVLEHHSVQVNGPTKLIGRTLISHDIRDGAALVLAALAAQGKSVIENVEIIDRGYEKLEQKLQKMGAQVKRIA